MISIGPKAQAVLKPFLDRDPEAILFSPRESEAWRLEKRPVYYYKKERKTKVHPCELRARAAKKEARKRRKPERENVTGATPGPTGGQSTTDLPRQRRPASRYPIGIQIS